jgi:holo-[acyl-carrier protein] synthase
MQITVGVDSVEVSRIQKAMSRESFLRVFTEEERAAFAKKPHPEQSAAGHFAAKEAFAKAMGTGFRGFRPEEVSIVYTPAGAPQYHLLGRAAALCGSRKLSLSITHTETTATAFVIAYEEG